MIFPGLLFFAIFLSCKKEVPLSVAKTNTLLLSQIKINNQPYYSYLYTSGNLISVEKSKYDFTLNNYNDKNQLIRTDYYTNINILSNDLSVCETALNQKEWFTPDLVNKGGSITYDYNDKNQLVKATYTPVSGSSQYSLFSYGANDLINRQMLYWETNQTGYIDYSFDEKGNLIEENLYNLSSSGVAELSTTTQYTFDDQQNPYKSVSKLMTPGINANPNNIIKETYTIHMKAGQGADKVVVTETSYKYNNIGFPLSKNGNVEYIYG